MNTKNWAENITKEIYSEYKNKYSFWKHGVKVFYSSVIKNPKLMIISYQPGGNEKNFIEEDKCSFENGIFELPLVNSYVEANYKMSKKVREFFDFTGGRELLENSVVLPLIFFRSPTIKTWKKEIPKKTRIEMEDFCFSKIKEIIEEVNPENVLVIGISTYSELKSLLKNITNEKVLYTRKEGKEKMAISAKFNEKRIFAVSHLSGVQISQNDRNLLKSLFSEWV